MRWNQSGDVYLVLRGQTRSLVQIRCTMEHMRMEETHEKTWFPQCDAFPVLYRRLQVRVMESINRLMQEFGDVVQLHMLDTFVYINGVHVSETTEVPMVDIDLGSYEAFGEQWDVTMTWRRPCVGLTVYELPFPSYDSWFHMDEEEKLQSMMEEMLDLLHPSFPMG